MSTPNSHHSVLHIQDLSYQYPGTTALALKNINLELKPGTINMLIGPNGSGKSTLIKLILGVIHGTGKIDFFRDSQQITRKEAHIGYVPQNVSLDTSLPITVNELLVLTQKSCNRCHHDTGKEVTEALQKVDALDYQHRQLGDLSGGQLRRVILARALLNSPSILILDEPESGIDMQGERFFYDVLDDLVKKEQMTALIASHELEIVSEYADTVICINTSLVCSGTVQETLVPKTFDQLYGTHTRVHAHNHRHDHHVPEKGRST